MDIRYYKKHIIIGCAGILALLLVFYFGYRKGETDNRHSETKIKIEHIKKDTKKSELKIESINTENKELNKEVKTLKEKDTKLKEEYKEISKPKDTLCLDLYTEYAASNIILKNRIDLKDSIINKQDTLISNLTHVISEKDNIIKNKNTHIDLLVKDKKQKKKPFGIGIQVGTTYDASSHRPVKPYVGVGISYNIINF